MRHYKARQLSSGGWEYTCRHDDDVFPMGYCGGWVDWDEDMKSTHSQEEYEKYVESKPLYHDDPHLSERDALNCYKRFLLDGARYDQTVEPTSPCKICGKPSDKYARVADQLLILCDNHRNRDTLKSLVTVGESWEH